MPPFSTVNVITYTSVCRATLEVGAIQDIANHFRSIEVGQAHTIFGHAGRPSLTFDSGVVGTNDNPGRDVMLILITFGACQQQGRIQLMS